MKMRASNAVVLLLLAAVAFAAFGGTDAEKLTLQQIKQSHPESALHWLKAMLGIGTGQPMSVEVQIIILALFVIPLAQGISFWAKWASKMIDRDSTMVDYFFHHDPQRSLYAFLSAMATVSAGAFTGAFSNDVGDFVGWYNVMYNLVVVGGGFDAAINKGLRPVWTADQRADAVVKKDGAA